MGGIASAIIIPPSGSVLGRVAPGFRGEDAFRRVAAVQPIAPRREGAPHWRAGFLPDDSAPGNRAPDNNAPDNNAPDNNARGRARDNREVRQLAIRPGAQGGADPRFGRAPVAGTGVAGTGAAGPGMAGPGLQAFGGAPFASIQFLAQVIGQAEEWSSGPPAYHPDGIALGSDAYRRAGAAPPHYSEQPTVFRVAI